ncbi:MAG: hypothetical protein QM767_21210 [Anaeromyxobacter sp.]
METSALFLRYATDEQARLREALEQRTAERDEALALVVELRTELDALRRRLTRTALRALGPVRGEVEG